MSDSTSPYERLQSAVNNKVKELGITGATLAIENIDVQFFNSDPKAIQKLQKLCLDKFDVKEGDISDDARGSGNIADSKRAFTYICVSHLRIKPPTVQNMLQCSSIATVYNYFRAAKRSLQNEQFNRSFVIRYREIKEEFDTYINTL